MLEKFAKLIDVKTIITFAIIGAIVYLGIVGRLGSDKMFELGLIIVGFYFGTQSQKKAEAPAEEVIDYDEPIEEEPEIKEGA
jgi:hypothetical protein